MRRSKIISIVTVGLLLGMVFILQLPQIHSHPSTPVEPSQCPMVLVNSNATGIAPATTTIIDQPNQVTDRFSYFFTFIFHHQWLFSEILLRAPPSV